MISKLFSLGASAIIIAYLYENENLSDTESEQLIESVISKAWNEKISKPRHPFQRVAVGVNADVDIIARATSVFRKLDILPGPKRDHSILNSLQELQEAFSFYFVKGSAAERPFSNKETYLKLVEAASDQAEYFVGGNAALMAQKIVTLFPNTKVQLVGPTGPKLKALLSPNIIVPNESMSTKDEFHLILEYQIHEKWGDYEAPVANRFITSHDISNSQLVMVDTFFSSLGQFNPDLVILSGLHMLEGQPEGFWRPKLSAIEKKLNDYGTKSPVHLELASMTNVKFLKSILESIIPKVYSIGLNEEELAFTAKVGNGTVTKDTFSDNTKRQPEISKIGDMILWVLKTFGYSKETNPKSKLTRVHFHSLTYHMIGVARDSWENSESAVAAGTRIAALQACDTKDIDPTKVTLKIPQKFRIFTNDTPRTFDPMSPIISVNQDTYQIAFSPVLVCNKPLKTVGLGDAVSATGLLYSSFSLRYLNI